MTRLAIIGTSHVAALKMGWERLAAGWPDLEVEFFAAPRLVHAEFDFIAPRTFGIRDPARFAEREVARLTEMFGKTAIDLSAVDHVLCAGWDIGMDDVAGLIATHDIDGLGADRALPRLSANAFGSFLEALADNAKGKPDWWNWEQPEIHVLPVPRPVVEGVASGKRKQRTWTALTSVPDAKRALDTHESCVAQRLASVSIDFIKLPDQVHGPAGVTRPEFSRDSVRLHGDRARDDDDFKHMNADYGTIVLAHALARIFQIPDTARNGT